MKEHPLLLGPGQRSSHNADEDDRCQINVLWWQLFPQRTDGPDACKDYLA